MYSSLFPPSPVAFTKLLTSAVLVGFGINKFSKSKELGLIRLAGMMFPGNCERTPVVVLTVSGSKIAGNPAAEKSKLVVAPNPRSASVGTVVVNTVPWRKANLSQLKKKKSLSLNAGPRHSLLPDLVLKLMTPPENLPHSGPTLLYWTLNSPIESWVGMMSGRLI